MPWDLRTLDMVAEATNNCSAKKEGPGGKMNGARNKDLGNVEGCSTRSYVERVFSYSRRPKRDVVGEKKRSVREEDKSVL